MKAAKLNIKVNEGISNEEGKEIEDLKLVSMVPLDTYIIEKGNTKVVSLVYLAKTDKDELITIYKPYNLEKEDDNELVDISNIHHYRLNDVINVKTIINSTPTYISEMNFNCIDGEAIFYVYDVSDQEKMIKCHIDISILSGAMFVNNNIFNSEDEEIFDDDDFDFASCQCTKSNNTELFVVKDIKEVSSITLLDPAPIFPFTNNESRRFEDCLSHVILSDDNEDIVVRFESTIELSVAQIKKIKALTKNADEKEDPNTYHTVLYNEDKANISIDDVQYEKVATTIAKKESSNVKKYIIMSSTMKDLLKKKIYEY